MLTTTPKLQTVYFTVRREHLIATLEKAHAGWEFRIGMRRLGDPEFRSEWPRWELVSEYRPTHHDRLNRFAIYGRRVGE